MNRKDFYRVSIIVVIIILFVSLLVWQQRANQKILIGQEQAIQNAIQACPGFGLQPVEPPTEAKAELTSYAEALYRQQYPNGTNPPHSGRRVWVVTLKGKWLLVGGPGPDPSNPGPFYWDECTIIIDARTGESLSIPIQ